MLGLAKLCNVRPSTAPIGNWGIISAVSRLADMHGANVKARTIMGKFSKVRTVPLLFSTLTQSIVALGV